MRRGWEQNWNDRGLGHSLQLVKFRMNQVIRRCGSDLVGYSCSLAIGELVCVYPRPKTVSGSGSQYFSRQWWAEDPIFTENIAEFRKSLPTNSRNHFFDHHLRVLFRTYSCRNRSEEHTSELQSRLHLVCRLLLEKKKKNK